MTKMMLNCRQARWSEFLTRLDFEIVYTPGNSDGQADALTRRLGDLLDGGDERLKKMEQVVRKPRNLPKESRLLADSPPAHGRPTLPERLTEAYETDSLPGEGLEAIRMNGS